MEVARLVPLLNYLGILAAKHPSPLSNKDLAKKAHVSKAAVSKVRDRLYGVCDDKALIRRKLVLRTDDKTAVQVFTAFLFGGRSKLLLNSPYGRVLIRKWVRTYHNNINKTVPEFGKFISDDDAVFMSELVVKALAESVRHLDLTMLDTLDDNGARYALMGQALAVINGIGPNLQRFITDEQTLRRILILRDKAWFLLLRVMETRLDLVFADLLKGLDDATRRTYLSVYRETAVFYLKRAVFRYVTQPVKIAAEKRKLRFENEYAELGWFLQPKNASEDLGLSHGAAGRARLEKEPGIEHSSH